MKRSKAKKKKKKRERFAYGFHCFRKVCNRVPRERMWWILEKKPSM